MQIYSNIVADVSKTKSRLSSEVSITKLSWKDSVAERFYKEYTDQYIHIMDVYINGELGIEGMGVADLVDFLNEQGDQMEKLLQSK